MYTSIKNITRLAFLYVLVTAASCNGHEEKLQPATPSLFETLTDAQTGLHFANTLTPTDSFNMFHYMYFYNGAGVGAGDFNNDGKIDLFFAANQEESKMYLNEGNLKFRDVTAAAKIPLDRSWSTGVSVIDINNDGLLDLYICKVGNYEILHGKNQLLICKGITDGIPYYADETTQYGLDFSGFSTQAAFFDYDMDGDLDMFLLNHSVHQNGTFAPRQDFLGTYNVLSGDRMFRNDGNNHFTDVTKASRINSSAISYGLGIAVADINLDGWPDLYVGNDFHENDYLYINQHDGTFKEQGSDMLMHTSQFSMGVDVADVNNDGYPEIISVDMLPSDPYILKRSLGEDEYDIFYHKISIGYNYQYTRNNFQYNRRNGMFSETGLYSGIYASDWSWAPLWMDFDNDGLKDLFISNGIPKRMNDMDYANFISDGEIQKQLHGSKSGEKDMALVNKFPEIKIPNRFFRNKGNLQFEDINTADALPTFSNGAVYADLDNDGDLDVVVNNVNQPVLVYRNKSNDKKDKLFAAIKLNGPAANSNAIGAKIILYADSSIRTYEKNPARGFESSMEEPLHIGLTNTKVDSAFLVWPDNSFQKIDLATKTSALSFTYVKGLPKFSYARITGFHKNETRPMEDITAQTGLNYVHKENSFIEFNREFLIPHMVSTEGPALAVGDINHDGLEDVFIGASRTFKNAIFLQQADGKFTRLDQPAMALDSMCEDAGAQFIDVNNDGHVDLVIASGGNEYYGTDEHLKPRVYLNDGKANFTKLENAFGDIFETQSCIVPYDFNGDGFTDLFIGGRVVPWNYGKMPVSYLLQNDGTGKFKDVTNQYAAELANEGMVTNALWFDIDKDGDKDLLVCCEWGGIDAFINTNRVFTKQALSTNKGWWNFLLPVDMNNDGNTSLIAGNLGLNSRLHATPEQPVRLYYNDFDGDGKNDQVLTYYVGGKEIPFTTKDELQKQLPFIKKKFLYAADFAKATLDEIFTDAKLKSAQVSTVDYFSNAVLINKGNLNFTTEALPWQAQLTSYRTAVVVDANADKLPDVLLMGNYYDNNIQMGRYDADFGTLLINKGNGKFETENINGLQVKGQVRHIAPITINHQPAFILAKNNDSLRVIRFTKPQ
ncbi:VCBS repeat-containing protein [Ferruginibacter profundus]